MTDILEKIIANKRLELEAAKIKRPLELVKDLSQRTEQIRSLFSALSKEPYPRIIAECKKQSPSRGILVKSYDPVGLAAAYERAGAAAISVLTDNHFFGGDLNHLRLVRDAVNLPVLRKDFIIDPYQIYEARAFGADSFLLLSGVLELEELNALIELGRSLGMEPLIESHTPQELEVALSTSGRIFGVNNRNLKNFSVDLDVAKSLFLTAISKRSDIIMVCESGIKNAGDIENLAHVGYKAFLIGEAFVTHSDPYSAVKALTKI